MGPAVNFRESQTRRDARSCRVEQATAGHRKTFNTWRDVSVEGMQNARFQEVMWLLSSWTDRPFGKAEDGAKKNAMGFEATVRIENHEMAAGPLVNIVPIWKDIGRGSRPQKEACAPLAFR